MHLCLESFMLITLLLFVNGNVAANMVLGGGINVFKFFGDLTIAMRVDPRNDTNRSWLLRDVSPPVFDQSYSYKRLDSGAAFSGNFQIDLCNDLDELYRAFFRNIRIEGLSASWQAFTKSWTGPVVRDKLGVPEEYQGNGYSYAFVRVSRYVETSALGRYRKIEESARVHTDSVSIVDRASVLSFIHNFGSHYISSYVIGDSLFQILVFSRESYERLTKKVEMYTIDWSTVGNEAVYKGPVLSQSGDLKLTLWAGTLLQGGGILSLRSKPHLLSHLRTRLLPAVILKLRLRLLDVAFSSDPPKRHWFHEVVINQLRLYESNT